MKHNTKSADFRKYIFGSEEKMIGFEVVEKSKVVAALSKFGFGDLINMVKNVD